MDSNLTWLHSLLSDREPEVGMVLGVSRDTMYIIMCIFIFLSVLSSSFPSLPPSQVRYAGYCLLSLLSSQLCSGEVVVGVWKELHRMGLWGACLDTALDQTESSLVREQVYR